MILPACRKISINLLDTSQEAYAFAVDIYDDVNCLQSQSIVFHSDDEYDHSNMQLRQTAASSDLILSDLIWHHLVQIKAWRDPSYKPDFQTCFDHFLLHTGGRGILDQLQKSLKLSDQVMTPSREVLKRFGNTSAASTWYAPQLDTNFIIECSRLSQ